MRQGRLQPHERMQLDIREDGATLAESAPFAARVVGRRQTQPACFLPERPDRASIGSDRIGPSLAFFFFINDISYLRFDFE